MYAIMTVHYNTKIFKIIFNPNMSVRDYTEFWQLGVILINKIVYLSRPSENVDINLSIAYKLRSFYM